ncbi:spermatogenesis-associated protein 31E1-like isoform X1 [Mustela erminea]|uniref:spermatogenesis-associated protein 31E1-like isoform X1 n=1 Tax=Mustela erminea TaxID=36723 RepID=UPI0013868268|nr:spermatogenesis-associated protein 31E1-like isoform X1 [Mustela erminea]
MRKEMGNYLFPQEFFIDNWLSSSPTIWAVNAIFALVCGLGLFAFFLSYFQPDPSSPQGNKQKKSRKYRAEPWRRSNRSQKSQTLKACRNCLHDLEEVHSLVSLLQSHLERLSDQAGFHQSLRQAAPGQVRQGAPAGAHQPCREPVEDSAPAMDSSPARAPMTGPPRPLASTLPVRPQEEQTTLKKILPDTVRKNFLPGNSYWASLIPAISGLGHASYPILSFSWWWESTKSLFLPGTLQHKCQQEHVSCHPSDASFWGGLTNRQIETHNTSFVNPDVQKLLELLISKRVELKSWKEKKKVGSVFKQWCPDNHVSFWGTLWKLLGAEKNTTTLPTFWNMKNKAEPLAQSQSFSSPKVLEDHLQWKHNQLFWGLPSLHSESLVATALFSTHSSPLQSPSVLFNGTSNCLPALKQDQISSQFSHAPPLLHRRIQPQPSTLTLPQPQVPLAPSVPIRPYSLPSQRRTSGVSCATSQKKTQSFIPTKMQHLEWPLLPKQQGIGKTSPTMEKRSPKFFSQVPPKLLEDHQASEADRSGSTFQGDFVIFNIQKPQLQRKLIRDKQQNSLPHKVQLSLELRWPQDESLGVSQAQREQRLSRPFVFKGKSSRVTLRTRSRYHRKYQARFQLEKNFGKGLWQCLKRMPTGLSRISASFPLKVLGTNSEKEFGKPLMRTLEADPGKYLAKGPDKKHLENTLKVHLHRKLGQISKGLIPVTVRRSWFMASQAFPKSQPHMAIRNLAPLKDWKPCINTSHELSFLCPNTQQKLETHIISFRVRRKWDLPLQTVEPIDLKLHEAQHLPFPQSSFPCSSTFVPGAPSKAKFYKFLGKPPQPHPGEKDITEKSDPTSRSPLPVPSPICEQIQQALGGTSPGDGHQSSETSLSKQEGRSLSQASILSLPNRTLHSKTVMGAREDNLEPSPSLAMARNELREESGGQTSPDMVATLKMKLRSQTPRSEGATEVMEAKKAPAWKVVLSPSGLANKPAIYVDLRRSGYPDARKSPSPTTVLVAQDPEEVSLKTKVSKIELQEKIESENQPEGHTTGVLPQDSPSDILLPDFATCVLVEDKGTNVLLPDSHTNAVLAADSLTTQESPSCSQMECTSGETPASPVSHNLSSSGSSSEGQQEPCGPKVEEPSDSQSNSETTDEGKDQKRPKPEENEDRCAEPLAIRASQASEIGHPPQVRGSGESLGSKYLWLVPPEKGHVFPESHFRQRMKNFLQCLNPNKKSKELEGPLQKGKPALAPAQSWVPVQSRLVMDNRAAETQMVATAVGQILVEKLGLHQGIRASEIYQHKELQAPVHRHSCPHRTFASTDQKRVMGRIASNQQGTPKGHSCPRKSQLTRDRNGKWESLPRDLRPPGRPGQHQLMVAGVSGRIHPYSTCSLQKYVSTYQAENASHIFPGQKDFLQEKIKYMQRKPIFSQISTSSVC